MEEIKQTQPKKIYGNMMFEMYEPYMCRIKGQDAKKGKDFEAPDRYRNPAKIKEYGYNWPKEMHMCPEGENDCKFVPGYEGRDAMPFVRIRHQTDEDHVDFWCYDVQTLVEYFKKVKADPRYRSTGPQLPGIERPVFLDIFQLTRLARVYNDFVQGRGNNIISRSLGGTTISHLTDVSVEDMKDGFQKHEIKRYYIKLDIIKLLYSVGYRLPLAENVAVAIVRNFKSSADIEEDYGDADMNALIKLLHTYNNQIIEDYDDSLTCDAMGKMLCDILFRDMKETPKMTEAMLMRCKYITRKLKPIIRDFF